MNLNIVFRILSFILMPVAVLIGLIDATNFLPQALSTPQLLLPVFVMAAIVMYVFSSFRFYRNGINGTTVFSHKTKDFIKVNGYVAMGFSMLTLVQSIIVAVNKELFSHLVDMCKSMFEANKIIGYDPVRFCNSILTVCIIFSVLIITHFVTCMLLLKQYKDKFVD
jgi:hypothetical protein